MAARVRIPLGVPRTKPLVRAPKGTLTRGFVVSCSRPESMPQSYIRYLSNSMREAFEMPGVPIRLVLRASENPFANKAKKRKIG